MVIWMAVYRLGWSGEISSGIVGYRNASQGQRDNKLKRSVAEWFIDSQQRRKSQGRWCDFTLGGGLT